MSPWTVVLLYLLVATSTTIPTAFDCNNPNPNPHPNPNKRYTCHGGRYYRKYWNHWKKVRNHCAADGTQLAIPYSAQDLIAMKEVAKGKNGKLGARHCNKLMVDMWIKLGNANGGSLAKEWTPGYENFLRKVEAEVVNNRRNKIYQTWCPLFSPTLY